MKCEYIKWKPHTLLIDLVAGSVRTEKGEVGKPAAPLGDLEVVRDRLQGIKGPAEEQARGDEMRAVEQLVVGRAGDDEDDGWGSEEGQVVGGKCAVDCRACCGVHCGRWYEKCKTYSR